jgi:hypothetical protein
MQRACEFWQTLSIVPHARDTIIALIGVLRIGNSIFNLMGGLMACRGRTSKFSFEASSSVLC